MHTKIKIVFFYLCVTLCLIVSFLGIALSCIPTRICTFEALIDCCAPAAISRIRVLCVQLCNLKLIQLICPVMFAVTVSL